MRCPKIGKVIAAIHAAPERDWSEPMPADVMGALRSSFAEAFTRTMGENPAEVRRQGEDVPGAALDCEGWEAHRYRSRSPGLRPASLD